MKERTLVLIKPDGVQRGLVGTILERFERIGLKPVAMKMVSATKDQADRHYALTEDWMMGVFTKAKAKYDALGQNFPYEDHKAYGKFIKDGLIDFIVAGPIVAMVLEGEQSVSLVRKLVGATEPASSAPGTIRGDYCLDTYALSNAQSRPLRNLIHASGNVDEANTEIPIWFAAGEIMEVKSANDPIMYDEARFKCV
jgi:nucleoside-diphosphate kinase